MAERILKMTYHDGQKRSSTYLKSPPSEWLSLCDVIEMYLFKELQLPQSDIRVYWIGK